MSHVRSSIAALALALALGELATPVTLAAQVRIRELGCRGGPGLSFRVDLDPSPRDTTDVVMRLDYRPSAKAVDFDYRALEPGTCTWNPTRAADYPAEPGNLRFDVNRNGQPWAAKDTSIKAGAFFPDPASLPRYLGDARHYYRFFVDDSTRFAVSFGALHETGEPVFVMTSGPTALDPSTRREIRCRGGTGLMFGGGGSVGTNLASVTMSYRVSANVPGESGRGLTAGSCAWVDRTGVPAEPGKVTFTTASNAQLRQIQSGSTVDRSPTAAVRYPDVRTIPAYLVDPAHYWTFTVTAGAPDKASIHGAWIRTVSVATTLATARATPGATTLSRPTATGTGSGVYQPGARTAGATSLVGTLFNIKNVTVTPGLEGVVIRFEAAANSNPIVTIAPAPPGGAANLTVAGSPGSAGMMRYVAASNTKLARGTGYTYAIAASATGNASANNSSGTFKTLAQQATIYITEINLLSDGDKDSDGEVRFSFTTCPNALEPYLPQGVGGDDLIWGDGPHRVSGTMVSLTNSTPDKFRLMVMGQEDDYVAAATWNVSETAPKLPDCKTSNDMEPGRNEHVEWNFLGMDFDLTKYPGVKGGEQFVRRSKQMRNGTTLMFEIRGGIQVTRQ